MKKRFYFLIIISLLIISISTIIILFYESPVTGETVTGEATNANLAVSISVIGAPTISIINPENETYITSKNLLLNYSEENADNVWYNIDNGGNTSITSAAYFNTTSGTHTLHLYANNSEGESHSNITFTVNINKFKIYYNEYANSNKGSSTNFNQSSYEDIQNLSGIILHNTQQGKIKFNQAINLTDDSDPSDGQTNISQHINISSNRIEINTTALPNFNKSATLYFYNLTFDNPRILKDGVVCPSTICTQEDYSGGTLIFNVTHFTTYTSEETPATPPVQQPSGGGGGISIEKTFSINKETISVKLKQGQTVNESFTITNTGNSAISFLITTDAKLEKFIKINETEFNLNQGESKTIILDFLAREDILPDLYMGKIIIKAGGIEKEILAAIEVESKGDLLDVEVKIPDKFLYIMAGEELYAELELFNIGKTKTVDVLIDYMIRDEEGNNIVSEQEMVAVEIKTTFLKEFQIPENVKTGKYMFYVKATYNGEVASSSAWFDVSQKQFFSLKTILMGLSIIAGLILLIIIIYRQAPKLRKLKVPIIKKKKQKHKKEKRRFFGPIFKKEKPKESLEDYKMKIKTKMEKHKK